MALSKKDQINIKLHAAKQALESAIDVIRAELAQHTDKQINNDDELLRKRNHLRMLEMQLKGIYDLFVGGAKKQKARLILAECHGELKDGSPCGYKIRASMATLMRGVPNCPDPMCKRKGKPFEVEIRDDEIDGQIEMAIDPKAVQEAEAAEALRRKEKDLKRAANAGMPRFQLPHEKVDSVEKAQENRDADFERIVSESEEWLENAPKGFGINQTKGGSNGKE